jgi:hypothetical protein
MDPEDTVGPRLQDIVSPWPIASNISHHLGAGDLISLARTNSKLRAVLHGFEQPTPLEDWRLRNARTAIRCSVNVGGHATPYWTSLKDATTFTCYSATHIRGDKCRPCRSCSRPICETCIVRSSLKRGYENTFHHRIRNLCPGCWQKGSPTKSRRYSLNSNRSHAEWYAGNKLGDTHCICTLKADGWLCEECKDRQNQQAVSSESKICHGEQCNNSLGDSPERRRICTWCQKTLPTAPSARAVWTQEMVEAKQRTMAALSADLEEYNRLRPKTLRMSRRELRGDAAVRFYSDPDKLQYVRHLDAINYESFISKKSAPTGQEIFDSKRGYWRYNRQFLLSFRRLAHRVPPPIGDLTHITSATSEFARTNVQKMWEYWAYKSIESIEERVMDDFSDEQKVRLGVTDEEGTRLGSRLPRVFRYNLWSSNCDDAGTQRERVREWHALKSHVLDAYFIQRLDLEQAMAYLWVVYGFWAEPEEYEIMVTVWGQDWGFVERPEDLNGTAIKELIKMELQLGLQGGSDEASQRLEVTADLARLNEEWEKADHRMHSLVPLGHELGVHSTHVAHS